MTKIFSTFLFFIIAVISLLAGASYLGTFYHPESKENPIQSTITAIDPEITLMPNQVPRIEKLHYAANLSYRVKRKRYYPQRELIPFEEEGMASWYGEAFHGRLTTSGEPYNMYEMTAAHRTLPIPSYVRVTNLDNQKTVIVRINDRGPFHNNRIIDLSYTAAQKLGYTDKGVAHVHIEQILPEAAQIAYPTYLTVAYAPDLAAASKIMHEAAQKLATTNTSDKLNLIRNSKGYEIRLGPLNAEESANAIEAHLFPLDHAV